MDFGEPDAHHLFTLTQSDERLQMKFSALVEHVSKKPIPPHVNYLIVEVMVSDEDDEDVEVSLPSYHCMKSDATPVIQVPFIVVRI